MNKEGINYKIHSSKLSLLLLSVCAALQLGDWHISRYFPILLCVATITFIQPFRGLIMSNSFKIILRLNVFCLLLLIFISFIGNSPPDEFFFDVVKLSLAFISSIWFFYFVTNSSFQTVYKSIIIMNIIVQVVMAIVLYDLYFDFSWDYFLQNFYLYKVKTKHFYDTNALALFGLVNFSTLLYFYGYHKKTIIIKLLLFSYLPLMMLCLSRAAFVALCFILFYHVYKQLTKFFKFVSLSALIILFLNYISLISGSIYGDGSGLSKIGIYTSLYENFPKQNFRTILFGEGINQGNYTYSYEYGKYSHALIPMLLGQFGFVGSLIYFLYFYLHYLLFSSRILYIFIPMFIAGLSYLHPFLESVFIASAIVIGLEVKRLQK
jgi:hypothetical protein